MRGGTCTSDAIDMRRILSLLAVMVASATMFAGLVTVAHPAAATTDTSAAESQFFALLNQARADNGLPPVVRDAGLDNVAVDWSTKMQAVYAKTQKVTADGDCSTHALCHRPDLGPAVAAVEPAWQSAGENIGTGFSVESLHTAFMNSPGHFANIVGNYNRLGVGVVTDGDGRIWVTFDFLRGPAIVSSEPNQSQPQSASPHAAVVPLGTNARFTPATPTRVADTRASSGTVDANEVLVLQLASQNFVPADATGVALNVTAVGTTSDGFVTVYPCGRPAPDASSVNFTAGHAVPNLVTVAMGTGGTVCVVSSSPAYVIADLSGWYSSSGQRYTPSTPKRLLDSRASGTATTFKVSVAGSVSADAVAVTVNATVTGAAGAGFLTAYPCGIPAPNASNVNFDAGQTVPNQVTVRIGTERSICFTSTVATNLLVDLSGGFAPGGSQLTTVVPSRFLDTRFGVGGWMGRVGAGQTVNFGVGGVAGITSGATAAVLNVTVAGADASGFLTVYPCDQPRPDASNLNFVPGTAVANAVTVKLATDGRVCVFSNSRADVLVDLAGYLAS
jgi:uncharacterized protein YkwD